MQINVITPAELSDTQIRDWKNLLQLSEELSSPFFSPEFTQAVARHCGNVYVALLQEEEELVGVFPFQRGKWNRGWPVGGRLNDFQAGIFTNGIDINTRQLLRACDLREWHFDHLITSQPFFQRDFFGFSESPYIDLKMGFDAFVSKAGSTSRIKTLLRKERKLAREIGPLRFEFHTTDRSVFESLITLKSQHLRQKKLRNVLSWDWVLPLLDDIRMCQSPGCSGTLSALYAGNELVATHLGIRDERVIHWWFTTFDPKFEKYSAGAILLLRLVEHAAQLGLTRLDLGKGEETYKKSFQTGYIEIAEGVLTRDHWNRALQHTGYRLRNRLRATPLRSAVKAAKRIIYSH